MINPSSPEAEGGEPQLGLSNPWDKQPSEPVKWFARFELYRQLGPGRSLFAAYHEFRKRSGLADEEARESAQKRAGRGGVPRSWNAAAVRFNWQPRAEAFDLAEAQEQAEEWARRRDAFRDRQWQTANSILDKTGQMLVFPLQKTVRREDEDGRIIMEIHPSKWMLGDVPRLALAAQKLGEAAVGPSDPGEEGRLDGGISSDELAAASRDVAEWENSTYGTSVQSSPPKSVRPLNVRKLDIRTFFIYNYA